MRHLETQRLTGEPLCEKHFEALRSLHDDERAMKTLTTSGKPQPGSFTRGMLNRAVAHWESSGFGIWAFAGKASTEDEGAGFVGYCGLRHYLVHGEPENELLYGLLPDYWGRGYASEMAAAALEVAFNDLAMPSVVAFTLHDNIGSRRVMEKNGMTYEKDIFHAGLPHVLYRRRAGNTGS